MTRVLVLTNMYPPHHYGGYELSCRDFLVRLAAHGHDAAVLTSQVRIGGVDDPPGERDGPVPVWRDLDIYWDDHVLVSPSLPRRLAVERDNQRRLSAALERWRPDVVSAWAMGAMSLGLLDRLVRSGIPVVYAVCDDWLDYGVKLDAWMRLFVDRPRLAAVVRRVAGVPTALPDIGGSGTFLFVSDSTRRRAEEASPWSFPDASVVYSGIDRVDFPPLSIAEREERLDRSWRGHVLSVGRPDPRKGMTTAVRALTRLSGHRLEIIGRGDDAHRVELEELAASLGVGDALTFDVTERSALRRRYLAADVFVFPSTWAEPFGLVPIEAMACGVPVVATAVGGSAEFLVDDVNCVVVAPGDDAALAAAIDRLRSDPTLRTTLLDGGLATAEQLTVDRWATVMEAWHLGAADRFAHGRPAHRPAPAPSQ